MSTKNGPPKAAPARGTDRRDEPARDQKKPVHEVRLGRIRTAVWLNDTDNGPRYNAQISRLCKDKNDQWKDSTSFGREDLPLVAKVADLAMVWMYEHPAAAEKKPRRRPVTPPNPPPVPLGQTVATPAALGVLSRTDILTALRRRLGRGR